MSRGVTGVLVGLALDVPTTVGVGFRTRRRTCRDLCWRCGSKPADEAGFEDLFGWLVGFGAVPLVGVEGTGSWGAWPGSSTISRSRRWRWIVLTARLAARWASPTPPMPYPQRGQRSQVPLRRPRRPDQLRHLVFCTSEPIHSRFKDRYKTGLVPDVQHHPRDVLVLDDIGFGQLGTLGGMVDTPNFDKLAAYPSCPGRGRRERPFWGTLPSNQSATAQRILSSQNVRARGRSQWVTNSSRYTPSYVMSRPCAVSAQMTATATAIMMMDHTG